MQAVGLVSVQLGLLEGTCMTCAYDRGFLDASWLGAGCLLYDQSVSGLSSKIRDEVVGGGVQGPKSAGM